MDKNISVVIPAYNEGGNISAVLKDLKDVLKNVSGTYEIIVVDDGSSDNTLQQAREHGARVISHESNCGYGCSLKDGIRAAQGELILLIDADGTYDIGAIPAMIKMAKTKDMVVGKRIFLHKGRDRFKNLTRRFFAYYTSYYSGRKIEDLNSGQRIFRKRDIVDKMSTFPDGFSFSSTMTVQLALNKKSIVYIPIKYVDRNKGSKFISSANVINMVKLAFRLTMRGRPYKLTAQLLALLGADFFLAGALSNISGGGVPARLLFFIGASPAIFLLFLSYIYFKGRSMPG